MIWPHPSGAPASDAPRMKRSPGFAAITLPSRWSWISFTRRARRGRGCLDLHATALLPDRGARWDPEATPDGTQGLRLHDLLRGCGTLLISVGVKAKRVQTILRHSRLATTNAPGEAGEFSRDERASTCTTRNFTARSRVSTSARIRPVPDQELGRFLAIAQRDPDDAERPQVVERLSLPEALTSEGP